MVCNNDPVLVAPSLGANIEPSKGVDPRIRSSAQTCQYGHMSELGGSKVMQPGRGVRSGEAASVPKARIKLPNHMMGSTQGQGVYMENGRYQSELQLFCSSQPYLAHCLGLREWLAEDASVRGSVGVDTREEWQRYANSFWRKRSKAYFFSDYRDRFTHVSITYQKRVFILSPLGLVWKLRNLAAVGDSRGNLRLLANSTRVIVIEGCYLWAGINGVKHTHDSVHVQDDRNRSTQFVYQWHPVVEDVYHASMMLCNPEMLDTVFGLIPTIGMGRRMST